MVPGAREDEPSSSGRLIATVMAGSWRDSPPPLEIAHDQLASISATLLKSAAGALTWRRIRETPLDQGSQELRQAYRLHSLQCALHQRQLEKIGSCLTSAGFPFLLGKGWAVARLYPEPGLRPYGDFDLYVPKEQHSDVLRALGNLRDDGIPVDLHRGLAELDDRRESEIQARSLRVRVGEVDVRVLGHEDHLRLLCLHMFKHGAWRPLWLCDVAVLLETCGREFDWPYFLSGDERRTEWSACAIILAHELLGARVDLGNLARWARPIPRWLVPTVLRQWGNPPTPHGLRTPMKSYLRRPSAFIRALAERWPNPIEATVAVRGAFNGLPRLPYQVGECLLRTARFMIQLTGLSRKTG